MIRRNPLAWIGLAGVESTDNPKALAWQRRLQWPMVGMALAVLLGYMLDNSENPAWHRAAAFLDVVIFLGFLGETVWMAIVSSHPVRYVATNWLNLVILIATFASILGAATEWVALVRVLRAVVSGMVLARTASRFNVLFTRRGAPILVGAAVLILLASGGMFYWVEPTLTSYWDGLWLAFITGTTIGYGDIVRTSGAAKMLAAFTVLIGVSIMALFTANVVSFSVANEDLRLRHELRHDLVEISNKVTRLLQAGATDAHAEFQSLQSDLHHDLHHLRRQVGQVIAGENSALVKQLQQEVLELTEDVRISGRRLPKHPLDPSNEALIAAPLPAGDRVWLLVPQS